jgi:hypothetical protein
MGVGLKNSQHHIPKFQDQIEFAINEGTLELTIKT